MHAPIHPAALSRARIGSPAPCLLTARTRPAATTRLNVKPAFRVAATILICYLHARHSRRGVGGGGHHLLAATENLHTPGKTVNGFAGTTQVNKAGQETKSQIRALQLPPCDMPHRSPHRALGAGLKINITCPGRRKDDQRPGAGEVFEAPDEPSRVSICEKSATATPGDVARNVDRFRRPIPLNVRKFTDGGKRIPVTPERPPSGPRGLRLRRARPRATAPRMARRAGGSSGCPRLQDRGTRRSGDAETAGARTGGSDPADGTHRRAGP